MIVSMHSNETYLVRMIFFGSHDISGLQFKSVCEFLGCPLLRSFRMQ